MTTSNDKTKEDRMFFRNDSSHVQWHVRNEGVMPELRRDILELRRREMTKSIEDKLRSSIWSSLPTGAIFTEGILVERVLQMTKHDPNISRDIVYEVIASMGEEGRLNFVYLGQKAGIVTAYVTRGY